MNLLPTWTLGDLELTDYPYSVEFGGDHGAPETVMALVQSMMADGDITSVDRYGNREVSIVVLVEGADLLAVADAEAALRRECARPRNALTFDPGDGFAPPTVFDVLAVEMRHARDDSHEMHLLRRWEITLTCEPFARSLDPVTIPAMVTTASTPTLIDDCSSAAGWTATVDGIAATPTASGGAVSAEDSTSPKVVQMSRSGSVVFGASRYLIVEAATNSVRMAAFALVSDTAVQFPLVGARLLPSGWIEFVYDTAGATSTTITFVVSGDVYGSTNLPTSLAINGVWKAITPPQNSPRQLSRVIIPGGTERTPASIHVSSNGSSAPLGMTIVHTSPETGSGYSPPLRRWRVSGNAITAGPDTFSGSYEQIHGNAVVFEVPNSAIPEGEYALCVALKTDTVGTHLIHWSAQTRLDSSTYGTAAFEGATPVQFFTTTDWHFASLTPLSLPTMKGNAGSFVRIAIQYQGSGPTIIYDDAWPFRVGDDCALSVINAVPPHLWLDSPGVRSEQPEVSVGSAANRSDAWHPGLALFSTGVHMLHPDGTALFTAARDFDNASAEAEFYRRWHSSAAT